jgi:hypothetical protein
VQTRLGAAPEAVYTRRRPIEIGSSLGGPWLLVPLGALLLLAVLAARRRPRRGAPLVGAVLGLVGLLVAGLSACSALPELHNNEVALLCLPSDLLLLGMPVRWAVAYARLRLCGLLLCAGALAASLLIQPLVPVLLFCALPLAGLAWRGGARRCGGAAARWPWGWSSWAGCGGCFAGRCAPSRRPARPARR